ncbi:DUF4197 domain-containing protein [Faecalibacter macacae]|uniref:DUF4197 domain-containing protein n=1 Tax=Faecalibacter macacae TaxID=1859289 RepID=A0A3L9M837_9FLAO|nr:DUF4197 domain-containing protein [Faecalibacter macacae]RLZ08703.1 DUF4197 domain-containing protein [Faecalibacter macacae]
MKKIYLPLLLSGLFLFSGCAELQTASQISGMINQVGGLNGISNAQISSGLKEALNLGLSEGILKLGQKDGFKNNALAKILLPEELQGVEKTLRSVGLGSLADKGLNLLNEAAGDAVTEAAPIFKSAITGMSFQDATGILMGGDNAATNYLQQKTTSQLTAAFQPKVANSLGKVGADKVWSQIITKYNAIAGKNINPDLNGYVTEQAVKGVFNMVAEKEAGIRNNSAQRSTDLLKQVFALQDKK